MLIRMCKPDLTGIQGNLWRFMPQVFLKVFPASALQFVKMVWDYIRKMDEWFCHIIEDGVASDGSAESFRRTRTKFYS